MDSKVRHARSLLLQGLDEKAVQRAVDRKFASGIGEANTRWREQGEARDAVTEAARRIEREDRR